LQTTGPLSVPATERAFSETPPLHLYLDTNILIAYFVANHPQHIQARDFLVHLYTAGLTTLYVSPLTWTELTDVVSRPEFRAALPPEWQREARFRHWDRLEVRRAYLESWWGALDRLLLQYAWDEIVLTPPMRVQALGLVRDYGLESADALHLAAAQAAGVLDFASFDAAFRRVDGLYLWNDLLHQSRTITAAPPRESPGAGAQAEGLPVLTATATPSPGPVTHTSRYHVELDLADVPPGSTSEQYVRRLLAAIADPEPSPFRIQIAGQAPIDTTVRVVGMQHVRDAIYFVVLEDMGPAPQPLTPEPPPPQ
jgi:predicted nucleic acid-binding protein